MTSVELVLLGGAPGVGKSTVARELLTLVATGDRLVQWIDVDDLWQHRPWRVDETTRTMLHGNLRTVLANADAGGVDIAVVTWVFQSRQMQELVRDLAPSGIAVRTIQLRADTECWRQRFESDQRRPAIDDFYRDRYASAQRTPADDVIDTTGSSAAYVAGRVAALIGL